MAKQQAIKKLQRQLDRIEGLRSKPRFSPEFTKWCRDSRIAIERIFGEGSDPLADFTQVSFSPQSYNIRTEEQECEEAFHKGIEHASAILRSLIDEVEEYGDDQPSVEARDAVSLIKRIYSRFHLVVRQLQSRHDGRPALDVKDEYDVTGFAPRALGPRLRRRTSRRMGTKLCGKQVPHGLSA